MNGTDEPVYVYRVIADGKIAERVKLIACRAGGWREYESEDLGRFKTRDWYPHTTAVYALLHYINQRARRMVTGNVQASRHLLDQIENAVNTIQGHLVAERRARELKDQRMCGY